MLKSFDKLHDEKSNLLQIGWEMVYEHASDSDIEAIEDRLDEIAIELRLHKLLKPEYTLYDCSAQGSCECRERLNLRRYYLNAGL